MGPVKSVASYEKDKAAESRWKALEGGRGDLTLKSEKYAFWTVPAIFSPDWASKGDEQPQSVTGIGARAVNNFANKLVMALFPPNRAFFRLKAKRIFDEETVGLNKQELQKSFRDAEDDMQSALNARYVRTEAANIAKYLIVTGNALMYNPPKSGELNRMDVGAKMALRTQVKTVREYVTVRNKSGHVVEFMTIEKTPFRLLDEDTKLTLLKDKDKGALYEKDAETECCIYTWGILHGDKYTVTQYVECKKLDYLGSFPVEKSPWTFLVWNLFSGEHYGRGLVEDHAGDFHELEALKISSSELIAAMSDIKFLVRPGCATDVAELNNAESGSYHAGQDGDVTPVQIGKIQELAAIQGQIGDIEQRISQVFLMLSGTIRDAERVTREEIRRLAQELDVAHAGIYSRLAEQWQEPLAKLGMRDVGIAKIENVVEPVVLTGLESLSREADMDAFAQAVEYMALFNNVPENFQNAHDITAVLHFIYSNVGLQSDGLILTPDQIAAVRDQEQAQIEQQQQHEIDAKVAPVAAQKAME